ncbi:hypothetical protein Tco_0903679 [Tanacetum coccineum]
MPSSSTVTYTSVYTDSEPGRVFWRAGEELSNRGSPRVIIYGYDGLLMQPVALPSPDYVPGPEHPPSPDYVPGPEHPPSPVEDPEEDPEEDHADYPTDEGDGDDEPSNDDDDDEDEDDNEEEERHLALADSSVVPVTRLCRARKTVRLEPPMSPSMEARIAKYAAAPTPPSPPPSPLSPWTSPLPQIPSPPLHVSSPPLPLPPPTVDSPSYAKAPLGYRAAEIRLRASSPSTHHPLHPSSPHLPPPVPTSLPLPSSPLPPLLASLFISPPVDRREDILEVELPPCKRLCPTAPTSRYEVEESSTAVPRPTGGHRADYRFINTMDAEIRRQRAEEVGYGIKDVWVDLTEVVEEVAPPTLKEVNARVTKLAAVQEQDTHNIYAVIEDGQDRQTQLFQRVDGFFEDRQFHYETT